MMQARQHTRSSDSLYSDLRGIQAVLERREGRVRIKSEDPEITEMVLPEIVEDASDLGDFRIRGRIVGYHNWTRQPREILESHLRDREAGRESDVRVLFEADELESLEGIDLESKSDSFRERMLWERFPDSKTFRKARPKAVRVVHEEPQTFEDETVATDVLFSTGHLDLDGVERRLNVLREKTRQKEETVGRLEDRLMTREAYIEGMGPLARIGEESVLSLAREAVARIEAIRLHLGDRPEDEARRGILEEASPDPELVREIHRKVTAEFTALYPTKPLAVPTTGPSTAAPMRFDAETFRVRGWGVGGRWPGVSGQ